MDLSYSNQPVSLTFSQTALCILGPKLKNSWPRSEAMAEEARNQLKLVLVVRQEMKKVGRMVSHKRGGILKRYMHVYRCVCSVCVINSSSLSREGRTK